MMGLGRIRMVEVGILFITIPIVIFLFKFIEERKVAATLAGFLFLVVGLTLVSLEWRRQRGAQSTLFWTAWFFLFASVFPILGLRLANWDRPFDETVLFGVTGPSFHRYSNAIYIMMVVAWGIEALRDFLSRQHLKVKAQPQK